MNCPVLGNGVDAVAELVRRVLAAIAVVSRLVVSRVFIQRGGIRMVLIYQSQDSGNGVNGESHAS